MRSYKVGQRVRRVTPEINDYGFVLVKPGAVGVIRAILPFRRRLHWLFRIRPILVDFEDYDGCEARSSDCFSSDLEPVKEGSDA